MNIVLLGYRGTGKSVVGRLLARRLHRPLYCLDDRIVQRAGMPIPEIVSRLGWPGFRELEAVAVKTVSQEAREGIIDCGGGVVLNPKNVERLREHGRTVLLTADFDVLLERLRPDANRPPLKNGLSFEEGQRQVLLERENRYLAAADFICDTTRVP
ncbi:MAG: shikimate kinase, partial [Nitrospinaceae bacterium]